MCLYQVNIAGDDRPNDYWEVAPMPIENIAAQRQPQDLQNNVMDYYDMAYHLAPMVSSIYPWRIHICP